MCVAPDYVCMPRERIDAFVVQARRWVAQVYPAFAANADYTSLINAAHAQRIDELLADARAAGAQLIPLLDAPDTDLRARRIIIPTLILGASSDMKVMREEIFAPLLPVCGYDS